MCVTQMLRQEAKGARWQPRLFDPDKLQRLATGDAHQNKDIRVSLGPLSAQLNNSVFSRAMTAYHCVDYCVTGATS